MANYIKKATSKTETPQSEPIPGSKQVANSAGGFAFAVDDWMRLDRFLILGSEGGSYYATERALTQENAQAVGRCIDADGPRTVARIVEVSEAGQAPKNDPAIFALALAASLGNDETRRLALAALPRVCRIGTHLFHFAQFVDGMRGWGRGLREAVARWYREQPSEKLAYQLVKYQQRDGWSHRDLLRLAHPQPEDETRSTLYHWVTQGWPGVGDEPHPDKALGLIWAMERAKRAASAKEVAALVREYDLPREAIPTQFLNDQIVWRAMLENQMPMTALIRNLATLTRAGLFEDRAVRDQVIEQITDGERLRRARVHPIAILSALTTYQQGRGERGQNTWIPVGQIVDALDAAFYAAFQNVTPTGKRWMLALDVSGSMSWGVISGVPGLTPRVASAAMALVTANVEKDYQMVAFTSSDGMKTSGLTPLAISPRQRMDDVLNITDKLTMGGTDCALPILHATQNKIATDVFVIYTDSETWAGKIHPTQALQEYRQKMGIGAKLIVVGMVANDFTIADPNDGGMLDVVGFDTAAPNVMADFARQ